METKKTNLTLKHIVKQKTLTTRIKWSQKEYEKLIYQRKIIKWKKIHIKINPNQIKINKISYK